MQNGGGKFLVAGNWIVLGVGWGFSGLIQNWGKFRVAVTQA